MDSDADMLRVAASYCEGSGWTGDGVKRLKQIASHIEELEAENQRLRAAMVEADDALCELNPGNYNDDDVRDVKNSSIEATLILRAALQPAPEGTTTEDDTEKV